jgi:hypothetical protein
MALKIGVVWNVSSEGDRVETKPDLAHNSNAGT